MKTLKTTISKTKYLALALFVAFSFSCSTEDGEQGPQGEPGIAGTNGSDGTNGNANVQVFTKDLSSSSGTYDDVVANELTQDIIDNDVILGYVKSTGSNSWHPLPSVGDNLPFSIAVYLTQGYYSLDFVDRADGSSYTVTAGYLETLKIVIIESTSSKTSNTSFKQQVYNELNQAGININDYYAVCDFYNIAY